MSKKYLFIKKVVKYDKKNLKIRVLFLFLKTILPVVWKLNKIPMTYEIARDNVGRERMVTQIA